MMLLRWFLVLITVFAFGVSANGQPQSEPLDGNTLYVGQVSAPLSLDPHKVSTLNDFRILSSIFEGLVKFGEGSLLVEPSLAKSWDISEDGKTYTFHLADGLVFHDGTPIDAAAVKYSFSRLIEPDRSAEPLPLAGLFADVRSIDTPDDLTVVFNLKRPVAALLANLAHPGGNIVPKSALENAQVDFERHPVGSGPFKFSSWTEDGVVTLSANTEYRGGKPLVDTIRFVPVEGERERYDAIRDGKLDIVFEGPAGVETQVESNPDLQIVQADGPHLWFVILNTKDGPFESKALRQAANYAINREKIVQEVLQGAAVSRDGPMASIFKEQIGIDHENYRYDPEKARDLIAQSGYQGEPIHFYVAQDGSGMLSPTVIGTAIQADLQVAGLNVRVSTAPWQEYLTTVNAGLGEVIDMAEMAWMTSNAATLPYLTLRTDASPENGGFNSGYYSNADVDELIEAAWAEPEYEKRKALYRQIDADVAEDAPWLFVASWKQNAIARANIKGFQLQPSFVLDFSKTTKSPE